MFDDNGFGPSAHDIKEKIEALGGRCTVAEEIAPSTGRKHMHVYAHRDPAFTTRDPKRFDIVLYHPNIRIISNNHARTWDYVTKGKNILVEDVPRPEPKGKRKTRDDEVFTTGLNSGSYEEMLSIIQDGSPRQFCTAFSNISAAARHKFPRLEAPNYASPSGLQIDLSPFEDVQSWVSTYIGDTELPADSTSVTSATPSLTGGSGSDWSSIFTGEDIEMGAELGTPLTEDSISFPIDLSRYDEPELGAIPLTHKPQPRPKSLILWGPSRTGKTLFARSLGRHSYHSTEFNLAAHDEAAPFAIFDDMKHGLGTKGFDYKSWLGGQHQFNCTDKYTKKKVITWGRPAIYISNRDPFETSRHDIDLDWLRLNTIIVHIDRNIAWVE